MNVRHPYGFSFSCDDLTAESIHEKTKTLPSFKFIKYIFHVNVTRQIHEGVY